jgi:hypothetical protein
MKYTKYFGLITGVQGKLNLSTSQFQLMMNIVHLEGVIAGLTKAKDTYKDTDQYHRYDMIIFKQNQKLTDLFGNVTPEILLEEMV